MSAHLSLRGVSRRHLGATADAVSDFSFDVARGEAIGLLGPSGSGKTTVLRLIAGLDIPDRGSVYLDGRDLGAVATEKRGVGLMSQRPLLFPHLNVLDNVAFGPRMAGASRAEARQVAHRFLGLVQLPNFGGRSVRALSGGQEQRVALARALATEPGVLLLDEPFSALDPGLRDDMHELLTSIRAILEPTIVLVTHDQVEAAKVSDRVAVLMDGALQQLDTPRDLYRRPSSLVVSRFLGCANEIPGVMTDGVHRSQLADLAVDSSIEGPAVLLIRQETLRVSDPDDADVRGQVCGVTQRGVRQTLTVTCGAMTLTAEVDPTSILRIGDVVGLHLPPSQRHVVPTDLAPHRVVPTTQPSQPTH